MVHILSKIVLALDGSRNAGVFRAALKSYPAIESSSQQLQEVFGLEVEEVRKMAQVLQREGDALRKRYNQKVAATKIQAWWRGIIQKRKWLSIRRGFISLQDLYRKRLLNKERFMRERLQKSELTFQGMYEEIVQNRIKAEKRFKELLEAKQNSHSYSRPIPDSRQDFQTQPEDNFQWTTRQEMAAVVIQIGVRKWLRRLRKRPIWLQSLMIPSTLNEEKIRRYQDEIELWQQNHQVPPMDPTELQELHQRAQLEFMAFNKRALESKRVEHMALSKMAQTKTILSILETAPTLEQYHPDNRTDFMSLPLPIAVKSRLEHKAAMARLNMPRWQRILQDIEN